MLPPAARPESTPIGPGLLLRALGSGWLSESELARLAALYLAMEARGSRYAQPAIEDDDEEDEEDEEEDDEGYEEAA